MSNMPTDLVQIDLDTAMALYLAGYDNIPIIVDNGYPGGWASMEPRHFEDLFDGIMFFASDSKRESLLNPPVTDIGKLAEEIALDAPKTSPVATESLTDAFTDDTDETDDDPDWVEDEPQKAEEIPDEDANTKAWANRVWESKATESDEVPTVSKVTEEIGNPAVMAVKDSTLDIIASIESGEREPLPWNVRDAIYYNEKVGISKNKLTTLYGLAYNTITKRINEYKAKS